LFKIDTGKTGIPAIFAPYQYGILKLLLKTDAGLTNAQIYKDLIEEGHLISRASVINYNKKLADAGIIKYRYESAKGGYRRKYYMDLSHDELIQKIAGEAMFTLLTAFPESDYLKAITDEV
jgi:Fe2+ or Zn2+ uptake regulation protein